MNMPVSARILVSSATTYALIALTVSAHAASAVTSITNDEVVFASNAVLQPVMLKPVDLLALRRSSGSVVAPRISCDPTQPEKVCDVRKAAARRALEVVAEENTTAVNMPLGAVTPRLLIPAAPAFSSSAVPALIQARAIACDPALSTEECAKLERRIPSNPAGPLPPNAPAPPTSPSSPPPVTVPEAVTPPSAVDPVPVTPPTVIPPPPTGDDDLVKRPPKSGSQMPVIKPKAAPPVNPQP